nr:DUF4139 domain-containing protein [candidate division Zixibacteria bacterium]
MRGFLISGVVGLATIIGCGWAVAGDLSVTVYNSNLGVVHETRALDFIKGMGMVSFVDVPSQIDPTSVGFEMVEKNKAAVILEQNFSYDLASPDKIYAKYIDRKIDLMDENGQMYSGELLSTNRESSVLRGEGGQIQIVRMEKVVNANLPGLPEGLVTRPTLFWKYNSDFTGKADCRVSYQTAGLNWSAEYVGILDEKEKDLAFSGWASITNNSGAAYRDATLKLIAGDINRATPQVRGGRYLPQAEDMMLAKGSAGFEEKQFFEYHLYTLPRKATIADNEIKQISLFDPTASRVTKKYYYQPDVNDKNVKVSVEFVNSIQAGLGMPLPEGRVRLFKADSDGSMILLGEDRIDHTPKDEEVKLTVGNAFDISAETKILNMQQVSQRVEEYSYEIELRNHKDENVTIQVEKKFYGDWEMIKTNYEYKKKDAVTIEFEVPVLANGKAVIDFLVRIRS